jgi:16S rRNA C967 or C1407 C5-methylase (RsmB/RsmF family)
MGVLIRKQPVADIETGIGAEADPALRTCDELPLHFIARLERVHGEIIRQEAQAMIAADAMAVVEVDDLVAIIAGEEPHDYLDEW